LRIAATPAHRAVAPLVPPWQSECVCTPVPGWVTKREMLSATMETSGMARASNG